MENYLVSILMTCYNSEKTIKKAIDSIIEQSHKNWELISYHTLLVQKPKTEGSSKEVTPGPKRCNTVSAVSNTKVRLSR